jgi:glutathione S-transferase
MPATLVTIRFSHFCEKARWALDHAGVRYDERAYVPGFHLLGTKPRGGRTVPLLVTPHGVLKQSTAIVKHADMRAPVEKRLYPDDERVRAEVDAFVADLDEVLGVATRLVAYHHMLPEPAALARLVGIAMSPFERARLRAAVALFGNGMRRFMRIDDASAARAIDTVRRTFDAVSARVKDGRRYLFGDRLGAADIAFAALSSPALLPPGHPYFASDLRDVPEVLVPMVEELRATDAGKYACRLYAQDRRA